MLVAGDLRLLVRLCGAFLDDDTSAIGLAPYYLTGAISRPLSDFSLGEMCVGHVLTAESRRVTFIIDWFQQKYHQKPTQPMEQRSEHERCRMIMPWLNNRCPTSDATRNHPSAKWQLLVDS